MQKGFVLHPRKWTILKGHFIIQASIFRGYVSFQVVFTGLYKNPHNRGFQCLLPHVPCRVATEVSETACSNGRAAWRCERSLHPRFDIIHSQYVVSTVRWFRNPVNSPVDMVNIPIFTGFYTSQVVQDFFHQQYH